MPVPFEQGCGCADCEAAVSPAAYLAALLDYSLKHVRKNDTDKINPQLLVDSFHQPFSALPTDCEAVEKQVRQVRLCIEVLRSYLGERPLADPDKEEALVKGEKDYIFAAYTTLLNRMGTSYEEIRRIRAESRENRRALAERLGIGLTEPRPTDLPNDEEHNGDELDQLFLDHSATPPKDHLLTEQTIEMLFGLADTTRDPLAEGAKVGNDQRQITRWNLNGVIWGQNTDRQGWVHVKLVSPAAAIFRIELYQDGARTKLVASGEIETASGKIKVVPENGSGLSGIFEIAYTVGSAAVSIAAVPAFLSWQLTHLRTLWRKQDYPTDAYTSGHAVATLAALPPGFSFPPTLAKMVSYDATGRTLSFEGIMSEDVRTALLERSAHVAYQSSVNHLYVVTQRPPIIDPDLIGPDDFRAPTPKLTAADLDRAFDIWLKRRAFIDNILKRLKEDRESKGLTEILQQVFGKPLPDLDGLLLIITKGDSSHDIEIARDTVMTLGLSVESFTRLMSIRAKYRLTQSDARNEKVNQEEWNELYSILTQATKVRQFGAWRTEEEDARIILGLKEFWFSVREPQEGDWPVIRLPEHPFIDPSITKLNDLPEWLTGKDALKLWEVRKTRLGEIPQELRAEREAKGLDAMLRLALGHPTPGNPLQHDLNTLENRLNSPDETVSANVTKQIEADLYLTVESFKRLILTKKASDQPDLAKKPTVADWTQIYTILAAARKSKHEYPQWVQEEQTAGLVYWKALKATLPRWRASQESRQAWHEALRIRTQQPLIDPAVIGADDLQHVIPGEPAFDVWKNRYDKIKLLQDRLADDRKPAPDTRTGLVKMIQFALGIEPVDLEALDQDRQAGHSIEKRLEQLNLIKGAFTYVMRIIGLATAAQPITDLEWEILYATLAQAKIQLEVTELRGEEQDKHIFLAPDYFKIPKTLLTPLPLLEVTTPPWLSRWQMRRDWQDTLQSRMDQENAIIEGLQSAIGAVEEATLPALRDALVQASDASGANLAEQAEWITARLLLDARSGGCRLTTRVAQALETLQSLIFDLRTGQFKQMSVFQLSLISDDFDEEWKWIGSYATWRSAMFVFLYPENILQPSLLKHKTPALVTFLANTRAFRLDPDKACQEANKYATYFDDICSLNIEATCQARTRVHSGDDCHPTNIVVRDLFFMFGRARSGKVYWSTYDPLSASGYAQSFWTHLDSFDNLEVTRIIGAMPYFRRRPSTETDRAIVGINLVVSSHIYLFCLVRDKESLSKLVFIKFNLELNGLDGDWDKSVKDLPVDLPIKLGSLNIVPVQTGGDFARPQLAFHVPGNTQGIYVRSIDPATNTWENSGTGWASYFVLIKDVAYSDKDRTGRVGIAAGLFGELHAVFYITNTRWVIFTNSKDQLKVMAQHEGDTLNWDLEKSSFLGALPTTSAVDNLKTISVSSSVVSKIYVFFSKNGQPTYRHLKDDSLDMGQPFATISDLIQIAPHSGSAPDGHKTFAYQRNRNNKAFYYYRYREAGESLDAKSTSRAVPRVNTSTDIRGHLSSAQLTQRRLDIKSAFALNDDGGLPLLAYLREPYYDVPMQLGCALTAAGHHVPALDWFRTVYDYEAELGPPNLRHIYYGLELDAALPAIPLYQQADGWLLDPLNPHLIASTRRYACTRFTLISLVRCMLDFADSEFTQETGESLARARTLYLSALGLLNLPELQQRLGLCDDLIAELRIEPGKDIPPEVPAALGGILDELSKELSRGGQRADYRSRIVEEMKAELQGNASWEEKLLAVRELAKESVAQVALAPSMGQIVTDTGVSLKEKHRVLMAQGTLDSAVRGVSERVTETFFENFWEVNPDEPKTAAGASSPASPSPTPSPALPTIITPSVNFCVPPNPILKALKLHAELNLYKLRTCRNIAGMMRQLDSYAAATDTTTGLPAIGMGGQLVLPGLPILQPTLYRYGVLIERTKQLVQLASQIEGAMLSALEKRDAIAQSLLQARQQLSLAQAGVRLQDLRIGEANDTVTLTDLQQERAQIQIETYEDWLQAGPNEYEKQMINAYEAVALAQKGTADASNLIQAKQSLIFSAQLAAQVYQATGGGWQGAIAGATGGLQNLAVDLFLFDNLRDQTRNAINSTFDAQVASIYAALEIRKNEWQLQRHLAEQDWLIGDQQKKIANDHVQIVTQERTIAGIQADNDKDLIEFLTTKFINIDLYDWMSPILERVYSFFLRQATVMAKLSENQLGFLRQEVPPAIIKPDYWQALSEDDAVGSTNDKAPERRGLTGSARLLQDIYQLDQYAFDTDKRKLQLTKTISLARMAPVEFQRFLETGVMLFGTPMEMFDRGFPGHYLRLIKRVRTLIIALVPPAQGICATLSTTGPSRVVVGGDMFQSVVIRRNPESVALSSPASSMGVFELDPQPDMLLPFEGSGVDMTWEFSMPKAANLLDYRTIADVLITMEYTALNSFDYRQQVIQSLKPTISADRPFSFRSQFADQWYDLHNSEQTKSPMLVRFRTIRGDFPSNIEALKIQHVLLYFVGANAKSFEIPVGHLRYTAQEQAGTVGGSATSIDGIISTRRGNAGSWTAMIGKSPAGEWELALPNTEEMKNRFKNEEIKDILLVITYSGRTPEWPS